MISEFKTTAFQQKITRGLSCVSPLGMYSPLSYPLRSLKLSSNVVLTVLIYFDNVANIKNIYIWFRLTKILYYNNTPIYIINY